MAWTILCRTHSAEKLQCQLQRCLSSKRAHCSFRGPEFSLSTHPVNLMPSSGLYTYILTEVHINKIESSTSFTLFPQANSVHLRDFFHSMQRECMHAS